MVDALREATRVLKPSGVLINLHPVVAPIVVEVITGTQVLWTKTVESYSAPEDVAAADAAVQDAISHEWIAFESHFSFDFEIYCDSAEELRIYAEGRKLRGAEIPYEELEGRRRQAGADGQTARLRCRRPWVLSTFRRYLSAVCI